MKLNTLTVSACKDKTVIVRVDYNVPLTKDKNPTVKDDRRVRDTLETLSFLLEHAKKIILIAHLGRPKSPADTQFSLAPVAAHLEKLIAHKVLFIPETVGEKVEQVVEAAPAHSLILLENLRFQKEEKANDIEFSKKLAALADVYINEAFSASHRSHASVVGVPKYLPAYAGFSLTKEATALNTLMEKPKRPFVVVLGGAKISDKVGAITHLSKLADIVLIGGAVANNFLKAEGFEIYRSFVEENTNVKDGEPQDYTRVAAELVNQFKTERTLIEGYIPLPKLIYPIDVIAGPSLETAIESQIKIVDLTHDMADTEENIQLQYFDIGPKTRRLYKEIIAQAGTVFWNGPLGVWENPLFSGGTRTVAKAISDLTPKADTILGGGDTIAAAHYFHVDKKFDYVSAAGGAALEFLSGKTLPGFEPLLKK